MRIWLLVLCVMFLQGGSAKAAYDSAVAAEQKDLRIVNVTPTGEDVPAERQIVITFNRPVVPLGRMERSRDEVPVTITPAVDCEWRWINTTSLACQLGDREKLTAATKYNMTINPGITAEDGTTITEPYTNSFITQRVDVSYFSFYTWRSPGTPQVRLTFTQPVTKKSVEAHMAFVDGGQKRFKLSATPDKYDRTPPSFVPYDRSLLYFGKQEPRKPDDQLTSKDGEEARRIWIVEPKKELPLDAKAGLILEPGLVSAEGPELSIAERTVVSFDTYPELAIEGIRCRSIENKEILITPGDAPAAQKCNPMDSIYLSFTAPVVRSQVKKNIAFSPPLGAAGAQTDVWGEESDWSRLSSPHQQGGNYMIALPYGLKPAQEYTLSIEGRWPKYLWTLAKWLHIPMTALEDEFARKLMSPLTFTFATDHRRPNFVLEYNEAVLEKMIDSDVPLYVNNLEKLSYNFRSVTSAGVSESQNHEQALPKIQDIQYAMPFGVRDALKGKSGAVYGHLETTPEVQAGESARRLFAIVTPYQVHVKLGHFSTLVWVTDMAGGNPVSDAKVTLYEDALTSLSAPKKILATSMTNADGSANLPGTAKMDPKLDLANAWDDKARRIFVRIDKGGEMALMPLSYDFHLDTYRVTNEQISASIKKKYGHIRTWGTTAQGIYRAGDTIQYKFYVRDQNNQTLVAAPKSGYTLEIVDPMGKVAETVEELKLNEFGAYAGEFKVAKEAAVGWYQFRLSGSFAGAKEKIVSEDGEEGGEEEASREGTWFPLRVLVSDFTPVPFKVTNQLNGDLFRPDQEIEVQADAKLHSGGPYTDASNRTTAILSEVAFTSKHPLAADFNFRMPGDRLDGDNQVFQTIEEMDDKGEQTVKFKIPQQSYAYGRLMVESAVQDDRGKYVAAQSGADYLGVDRLVGIKSPQWAYQAKKPVNLQYIVVDERGTPIKGTKVNIEIEYKETVAARVKGAGNAYLTNYTHEWKAAGNCEGVSVEDAMICAFTPEQSGTYKATASITDTQGRSHKSGLSFWVTGKDYVVWDNESDVLLPIVPEKTSYHVGDTARYLIKNPYPGAKALVTVERYGVLDSFVQTLDGSTPVIEFKVKPDYLPGFYLSVLVVSPRVDKPLETGQVDLGKPTFRMGYTAVQVKDAYKEMNVSAKAEQDVYRPRDKVSVKIHAEPRMKDKQEPIELAVAVLDEAVFDLVTGGQENFDPYNGFYKLDGLDLRNYSILTRLIGRQKFEKKGANPGGDGGADLEMRDLFKFVSYWNPSLKTDSNGNAEIEFEAPDNLTGWRVLTLAVTPSDRMGLGQANFKVNRPTEVRPVMPNQVTERDQFKAAFSVMNRTDKPREITVSIKAEGLIDTSKTPGTHKETVKLEPYKRATVYMPVQTLAVPETKDGAQGEIRFEVRASDSEDADGMAHTLVVNKMRSLETAANYGTTTQEKATESIQIPDNIIPDVGGISVTLAPSVIGSVEGAFKYMRDYPYICWEQVLSKGVMASHFQNLKGYMPDNFEWKDSDKLPQETLDSASSFQAPNGGMAYFKPMDEYVDPYLSAYTALAFNWLRQSGYKIPEPVEEKLHTYLTNLLKNDAMPTFYDEGMSSTVRAVALAALAEHGKVTKADLERYKPVTPQMSLFGKAHFLKAALLVKGSGDLAKGVTDQILAMSNQTGGKFAFNEEKDDSYLRILTTPMRENCIVLDAFVQYGETKEGGERVGDVPFKLVRSITQSRQNRDHWENTQENMFCMNALINYSRVYENVKPKMDVDVRLDDKSFGDTTFRDLRDKQVTLERKMQPDDVGKKATVTIEKDGDGRLYYATRLRYAPRVDASKPVNAGMELRREYSVERDGAWKLLKNKDDIKRGELVRVDLFLSLPAARNFVVVNDPLPGGLETVNKSLANSSKVDADKGDYTAADGSWFFKFRDWQYYNVSRWSFYHQELRHDSVRFYSDYLPPGNYHLSYTAQAIAEGQFAAMPTLAEEMYDPDVYGKDASGELNVHAP